MHFSSVQRITKTIVWVDLIINYSLGGWLLLFPSAFDHMIGSEPVLPGYIYLSIGIGLLLFAAWQTLMVARNKIITQQYLTVAAILAIIPIIILSSALLILELPVKPIWRTIIWMGDLYMVLLSAWYIRILLIITNPK